MISKSQQHVCASEVSYGWDDFAADDLQWGEAIDVGNKADNCVDAHTGEPAQLLYQGMCF